LDKNCDQFLNILASKFPVPGGGGACAYAGAIDIALGSMVGNLTVGKKKYIELEEDIKQLIHEAERIMNNLKSLVVKDMEKFYPLAQIFKFPEETKEQKKWKGEKIQESLIEASQVPLQIAQCCLDTICLYEEFAQKGAKMAVSDIGVGTALCKAVLQGAKFNVLINSRIMEDQKKKEEFEGKIIEIEKEAFLKADKIISDIEKYLMDR
jgi:formiminotetrahydrofolate cyclodeaminase